MNHRELRQECEPSLYDLIEERARTESKIPSELRHAIDYGLVHRVLQNERMRELKGAQLRAQKQRISAQLKRVKKQAGQLAKPTNS